MAEGEPNFIRFIKSITAMGWQPQSPGKGFEVPIVPEPYLAPNPNKKPPSTTLSAETVDPVAVAAASHTEADDSMGDQREDLINDLSSQVSYMRSELRSDEAAEASEDNV